MAAEHLFLTQPFHTGECRQSAPDQGGDRSKDSLRIMPFVSLKNATFMKNEMAGIDVTDEVLARYRADMTREEGEQAGVQLAKEVIVMTEDLRTAIISPFPSTG